MSNALTGIVENDLKTALGEDEFAVVDQLSENATNATDTTLESIRRIEQLLSSLDEKELDVMLLRFGLDGSDPLSAEDIGNRTGLSVDEVHRISTQALAKLREPGRYLSLVNEN